MTSAAPARPSSEKSDPRPAADFGVLGPDPAFHGGARPAVAGPAPTPFALRHTPILSADPQCAMPLAMVGRTGWRLRTVVLGGGVTRLRAGAWKAASGRRISMGSDLPKRWSRRASGLPRRMTGVRVPVRKRRSRIGMCKRGQSTCPSMGSESRHAYTECDSPDCYGQFY